jgi:hypothetical protein
MHGRVRKSRGGNSKSLGTLKFRFRQKQAGTSRNKQKRHDFGRGVSVCAFSLSMSLGGLRLPDQSRSNNAIDSTCDVCGNMLMTPAPTSR